MVQSIKQMQSDCLRAIDKCSNNEDAIRHLVNSYGYNLIDINNKNISINNYDSIEEYVNQGYFEFEDKVGKICYVVNDINIVKHLNIKNISQVFFVYKTDFLSIIEREFQEQNTSFAINFLNNTHPKLSAKNVNYTKVLSVFFISIILAVLSGAINIINNIIYFAYTLLKCKWFISGIKQSNSKYTMVSKKNLPIYSILIPLYKEQYKAKEILEAISNLEYDKTKLDIKILVEEDDLLTRRALSVLDIPDYVHVIRVPYSFPRTKPKALNYALNLVKGKYLTIYDAEDVPESDQLIKAVSSFSMLPEKYACLQAKLNFYNYSENILTRLFSIEYSMWFNYLLQGLSNLNLPLTLGGTSNHFKVDVLKKLGGWDAFNVTEDADLGIRIYMNGYKIKILDSFTLEEATTNIDDWLAQRSRWIKGFIQTLFVFMGLKKDKKIFGYSYIITTYFFVGISVYMFLLMPWIVLFFAICDYSLMYYLWVFNCFISLMYMYISIIYIIKIDRISFNYKSVLDLVSAFLWPFYFMLHTLASYRALYELIKEPFKWNKTPHGRGNKNI